MKSEAIEEIGVEEVPFPESDHAGQRMQEVSIRNDLNGKLLNFGKNFWNHLEDRSGDVVIFSDSRKLLKVT